jgi:predicted ATPase/DNA-binding NarL/FixJ family response regulator
MDRPDWHSQIELLTRRELEILCLIADGLSNHDIAERLVITLGTVKGHVKHIFSKLVVGSRTQAVKVARAKGLLGGSLQASESSIHKHNLPFQATPFVGRAEELAEIARLLNDPSCRLLTLVGPGGIGKTRLAIQTAIDRAEFFSDGVCFVPLASVSSSNFVTTTILNALGLSPHGRDNPQAQLVSHIKNKSMLLIMDNLEHLLDGVDLLSELLTNAPEVKLMTTSRERLGLQEEWLFQIEGMDFPRHDETSGIESYGAVRLFLQQARRVQVHFSLAEEVNRKAVIQICQLAEGMPLGIELAASWLRATPSQQIAERIGRSLDFWAASTRNLPERHRSIRSVFEHSWDLLTPAERDVLMKLSVFRGGFTLQAAEQVAKATIAIIVALIDKSLVHPERANRYDMHELLRQYAYEKLCESEELQEVGKLHLDFFLKLAADAKPKLETTEQASWLRRLDDEHDNLREAIRWAVDCGVINPALRLGTTLWLFWFMKGYLAEGREHLVKLLALGRASAPSAELAEVLDKAGFLARYQGDYGQAASLIGEGLIIYRDLGDKHGIANSLANLGFVRLHQADYHDAHSLYTESLALNRELENEQGIADTLSHLALMAYYNGDDNEARRLNEESLAIWRVLGDQQGIAWSLHRLGIVVLREKGSTSAHPIFEESLAISKELEFQWGLAWSLEDLARLAATNGDFERSIFLVGAAHSLRAAIGVPLPPMDAAEVDQLLAIARKNLDAETANTAWIHGQSMTANQALAEIDSAHMVELPRLSERRVRQSNVNRRETKGTEALNQRELEVLGLIVLGLSNRKIAERLILSEGTIKWYTTQIYSKLNVQNRAQAVFRAQQLNLFR